MSGRLGARYVANSDERHLKSTGSFYTLRGPAALLGHLANEAAIPWETGEWRDPEWWIGFTAIEPCAGEGDIAVAWLRNVRRRMMDHGLSRREADTLTLHVSRVSLSCWDINRAALEVCARRVQNVCWLWPHGVTHTDAGPVARLGVLELLADKFETQEDLFVGQGHSRFSLDEVEPIPPAPDSWPWWLWERPARKKRRRAATEET